MHFRLFWWFAWWMLRILKGLKHKIKRPHNHYVDTTKICIHILPCINAPEIFIENTASYPTKSSQKRCPINMTTLFDQSFFDRLVLQVNVWTPFDKQQLSMYVPGPRHFWDWEQFPSNQVSSGVDLLVIYTSKQMRSLPVRGYPYIFRKFRSWEALLR